jgi:hypothetical protein
MIVWSNYRDRESYNLIERVIVIKVIMDNWVRI